MPMQKVLEMNEYVPWIENVKHRLSGSKSF